MRTLDSELPDETAFNLVDRLTYISVIINANVALRDNRKFAYINKYRLRYVECVKEQHSYVTLINSHTFPWSTDSGCGRERRRIISRLTRYGKERIRRSGLTRKGVTRFETPKFQPQTGKE